ncbi:MAG: glycosyltransferase [Candidatus Saganbacteria bacterium]|nr:glycosyltransferase [Candidatus Saganbacteria bacterium]
MPLVSVNIPVFNCERYIKETVESVLSQTFQDYEIILIDDGSKDRTSEIIKTMTDPRIKYFYQENQGIGAARNSAIERSSGKYIAFLDHDDLWLPEKLEKQMRLFQKTPKPGLVYCDTTFFNEKGDLYSFYSKSKPSRGMIFRDLLRKYNLSLETVVIDRKVLKETGLFDPEMMMVEEYDLFLRIASKYPADYVDEPLAKYRIHDRNYSWGRESDAIREEKKVLEKLNEFIPNFKSDYSIELTGVKMNFKKREGLLEWKRGEKNRAGRIFTEIFKDTANIKVLLLLIFSRFMTYTAFSDLISKLLGKRFQLFE